MVRGTEVVFSALLSVAFLGRQLNRHHMAGIALCLVRKRVHAFLLDGGVVRALRGWPAGAAARAATHPGSL